MATKRKNRTVKKTAQAISAPQPPQSESGQVLQMINEAATNPEVSVEKLHRLLDLQERIIDRNAVSAFNSAFSAMQGELPEITERGEISVKGEKRNSYAKFEDVNEAIKPVLQRYGFAVSFRVRTDIKERTATVKGVLMHHDGHREETEMDVMADASGNKNEVQALGSAISYGKRYVLLGLLNITTRGEDDDGRSAVIRVISDEQAEKLKARIKAVGADESKFCEYFKIDKVGNLGEAAFGDAMDLLERFGRNKRQA